MKELKLVGTMQLMNEKLAIDFYGDFIEPYFVVSDIAKWLSVQNVSQMLKQADICDDQKDIFLKYTLGGNQKSLFVNEDGLYDICMSSRKPIAKTIKNEIKSYLKQIRLTGGYISIKENDTDDLIMARALKIADKTIQEKDIIIKEYQNKISELEPDAELARSLMQIKGLLTLKQVADTIEIGRTKLCTLLRQKNILSKQSGYNEPMGKYIKSSYFKTIVKEDEKEHISIVTLVTPSGLRFLYRLIKKNQLLDEFNTLPLLEVSANA